MGNEQYIPNRLPGPVKLLKEVWKIYKSQFLTFTTILALPYVTVFLTVLTFILVLGVLHINFSLLSFLLMFGGNFVLTLLFLLLLIIPAVIILVVLQTWGAVALVSAVRDREERINAFEAYRRGWHKIVSFWWVSFLAGFITFGGYLLLIVPGIIMSVWFSLAGFVVITEDEKGMNALVKSREYVKGFWGAVFGRIILIQVLLLFATMLPALIFSFIDNHSSWLSQGSRLIAGIFFTPLVAIYSFLIYEDLKSFKGEFGTKSDTREKFAFLLTGLFGIIVGIVLLFVIISLRANK